MQGRIHSIESFGTVDGPGIRLVVFMQGCPMRCQYCHNPDTWDVNNGTFMESEEILDNYEKNREFYKNGGLTVTGGEPLLQMDFLTDLLEKAKLRNIHTCIDTSGITFSPDNPVYLEKLDRLLSFTDLVLLDIKHIDSEHHKALTGYPNEKILIFSRYLEQCQMPVWIRHVLVPGITDDPKYLRALGAFIGTLKNLKALDVLPYHSMGIAKYQQLNMDYPLKDLADCSKEKALWAKSLILEEIRKKRIEN